MPVYERKGRDVLKRVAWDLIPDHIIDDVLTAMGEWLPTVTSRPYGDERAAFELRERLMTPDWVRDLDLAVVQAEIIAEQQGGQVAATGTPPSPGLGDLDAVPVMLNDTLEPGKTRVRWKRMSNFVAGNVWAYGTVSTFQRGAGSIHVIPDRGAGGVEFLIDLDRCYYAQGGRMLFYDRLTPVKDQGQEGPSEGPGTTEA